MTKQDAMRQYTAALKRWDQARKTLNDALGAKDLAYQGMREAEDAINAARQQLDAATLGES